MRGQDTYTVTFNFSVKSDFGTVGVDEEILESHTKIENLEELVRDYYNLWDEDLKVEISDIKIEKEEW